MTPDQWRDLEHLYDAVRDLPEAQKSLVLAGVDPESRERLVEILRQDGCLLDQPAWVGRKHLIDSAAGPGSELGPYKIEAIIGTGGMGRVYRAIDTRLGRTVAIKLLLWELTDDPAYRNRLLREARAVSALSHPNIVVLYDISCNEGVDFLVMEYLPGSSLKKLIPPQGFALTQVVNIGVQAASALAAAHLAGVVHRDVKPANILVADSQVVKVLDFGIAKLPRDATVTNLTGGGQIVGTIAYMSPEQTRGEEADAGSDLFSLGCVLYEAATGRAPFGGTGKLAMMHDIATGEPPAPSTLRPGIPAWFDALIAKCLRKERGERFHSMTELGHALKGERSYQEYVTHEPVRLASVAVLPFVSGGGNADGEHFGEGLAEDLIGALGVLPQLRVTPRSSAFSFRDKGIGAREIGLRLNVENVLEGSVRRVGQRLRINVQLIKTSDGYPIWSERFDRELTDIFQVQDEITATVVSRLRRHLVDLPLPVAKKRYTEDPEAYTLFLKGRHHWSKRPGGTHAAIECFQKALERDSKYALAYASLADCYNTLGSWEAGILAPEEAHSKGRAYAERALQLDPGLAEGHTALGYGLLHFAWDLGAAERSMQEAIRLNPAYGAAHHWYSHMLIAARRFDESRKESLLYLNLDPADAKAVSHFCWDRLMAHDFSKAEEECRAATAQEPSFGWHHVYLGWALLALGRPEEALRAMQDDAVAGSGVKVFQNFATHALAVAGEREAALAELSNLERPSVGQYVSPYEIGLIHEALGNRAEAFRYFEKAFAQRSPWLVYLANESRLMHLRGQPEFDGLVNRVHRTLHRTSTAGAAGGS
jgi:serine/threonine protein kinase/tetratricopeptide (TPR) repeat protein